MKYNKPQWKRNLISVEKIVWDTKDGNITLPESLVLNIVKDLGLKSLNNVNVLVADEGPVYLTEVLEEYLLEKYGVATKHFELDYVLAEKE